MAVQYSTTHRTNAMTDLVTDLGSTGYLLIYSGSPPSNCAASATGTLLASLPLSSTAGNVSSGVLTFNTITTENASATGTAVYYRLCTSSAGTTCVSQGTCATSGGDLTLTSTSITSGQPVSVTSWTITAYGA
ncbi:MAG: hypothetical protein B7Z66_15570 [Chromatiales bacterium 21-64-14]|nr:MAG: hypothetical protein B7Z66_15570 [Chromatiales bacterium 21-64-14]